MKLSKANIFVSFIFCFVFLPPLARSQEIKWFPFFAKMTGFVDEKGVTIIPPKYEDAGDFSEGLAWVTQNLKCGFIDEKGRMVIEPQYDSAKNYENGTAKVERDGKFGLIDRLGKEVLPLRYDDCRGFEDGMAAVRTGAQWGFVDGKGHEKISPQFDQVQDFSENMAGVELKDKWGFTNKEGEVVIQPEYNSVCPFSEGKAFVIPDKKNMKYSLIDEKGTAVPSITMYTDDKPQLHKGYALFTRCGGAPANCTHKLVDRKGQLVFEENIQYMLPSSFNPDQTPITEIVVDQLTPAGKSPQTILDWFIPKFLARNSGLKKVRSATKVRFFDQNGKLVQGQEFEGDSCDRVSTDGYWIKKGKRITLVENGRSTPLTIDVTDMILNFNLGEGLVAFRAKIKNPNYDKSEEPTDFPKKFEKMGFFDKTGRMIVGPEYDSLGRMSEGLVPFRKGNNTGYLRADGVEVIPAHFQEPMMGDFSEGLAVVEVDGRSGYINTKGEMVIPPRFINANPFHGGFALVNTSDMMVDETIDLHGRTIASFPNYYVRSFKNGLASAFDKKINKSGYVDKMGNWAIKPVFSWASDFSEGLAFVVVEGDGVNKCGFIDEKGAFRFPLFEGHYGTDGFKDGLAILSSANGSFVIDKTGKKLLESHNRSEKISFDQNGLIVLRNQSGLTKFFDKTGNLLLATCYSEY